MKFLLMMNFKITSALIYLCFFSGFFSVAQNDCFPVKDKLNKILVYDESDIFSPSEERALNQRLVQISNNTSNQIVVAVVNDLCGMDKATYATELGQTWGVGRKGKDNGIIIMTCASTGRIEHGTERSDFYHTTIHKTEIRSSPGNKDDYYKNLNDLAKKIIYYNNNYNELKKKASYGKNEYFRKFNSNIISNYIIENTLKIKSNFKYSWN